MRELPKSERQALKALDPMIRALVGPVHVPGFLPPGKPNVDQVSGGVGFGKLDGIVLASGGGKAFAIVSTVPLLDAWRKVPRTGAFRPVQAAGGLHYVRHVAGTIPVRRWWPASRWPPTGGATGWAPC